MKEQKEPSVPNGFGKTWLGCLVNALGGDYNKIHCRGDWSNLETLYIAEKPSVAQQFAEALKIRGRRGDGYIESDQAVVTWCVGHLVTMSYPEAYDMKFKRWSLQTLPFLPKEFKYEVITNVSKQFEIVKGLLNRPDRFDTTSCF